MSWTWSFPTKLKGKRGQLTDMQDSRHKRAAALEKHSFLAPGPRETIPVSHLQGTQCEVESVLRHKTFPCCSLGHEILLSRLPG